MTWHYDPRGQGFTLVELLVALAIAALAVGGLMHLFTTGLAGGSRADLYAEAALIAQSKLEEAGGMVLDQKVDGAGDEGRFHWQRSVRLWRDGDADYSRYYLVPYEVSVAVAWTEGARARSLALRIIKLGPQ